MPAERLKAALAAVQHTMLAERTACAIFVRNRSAINLALWTSARMENDAAWAVLWQLGYADTGGTVPARTGMEWVREMRESMDPAP